MNESPIIAVTFDARELVQFTLWRRMFAGLNASGAIPVAIDTSAPQSAIANLIQHVDGLVISGGGDVSPGLYSGAIDDPLLRGVNPNRDTNEINALNAAIEFEKPVLAICRGAQLVNVAYGGTLYADLARDLGTTTAHQESKDALAGALHSVEVSPGSRLASWMGVSGALAVNSQHHQGIRMLGAELVPTAFSEDGLVEAYESLKNRLVAVQWHPEVLWPAADHARALLRGFTESCVGPRESSPTV